MSGKFIFVFANVPSGGGSSWIIDVMKPLNIINKLILCLLDMLVLNLLIGSLIDINSSIKSVSAKNNAINSPNIFVWQRKNKVKEILIGYLLRFWKRAQNKNMNTTPMP